MHARASEAGPDFNADFIEPWRTEADCRIARKSKAFFWNTHEGVELPVGIGIVKNCDRIVSRLDCAEGERSRPGGYGLGQSRRIALTVRKMGRRAGEAGVDRATLVAQAGDVNFKAGRRCVCDDERHADHRGKERSHCSGAYQPTGFLNNSYSGSAA